MAVSEGEDDDLPEMLSESISPTTCNVGTQTEWPIVTTLVTMVDDSTQCDMPTSRNAQCQFPRDICEAVLADHTYCDMRAPQVPTEVVGTVPDLDVVEDVEEMDDDIASRVLNLICFLT